MSLGDLANGSPQDATDFATKSGGRHSGRQTGPGSGTIVRDGVTPPGGVRKAVFRQKYKSNLSYGKFLANIVISTLCI
jgi:hypothetical protein